MILTLYWFMFLKFIPYNDLMRLQSSVKWNFEVHFFIFCSSSLEPFLKQRIKFYISTFFQSSYVLRFSCEVKILTHCAFHTQNKLSTDILSDIVIFARVLS